MKAERPFYVPKVRRPFQRTRTRGKQTPGFMTYYVSNYGPPYAYEPLAGNINVGSYSGTFGTMTDTVTPGFRKTTDPSAWVSSPMTSSTLLSQTAQVSHTSYNTPDVNGRGLYRTWNGDGLSYILGPLVSVPDTATFGSFPDILNAASYKREAVIECLADINAGDAQSLVAIAELGKTVTMIRDRAQKIAYAWLACRNGKKAALEALFPGKRTGRRPKSIVVWDEYGQPVVRKNGKVVRRYAHQRVKDFTPFDTAQGLWLEYRYGWTPLIHDIVNGLKAVNAQLLRNDLTKFPFERVVKRKGSDAEQVVTHPPLSHSGGTWTISTRTQHIVQVKAYAKYQVVAEAGIMNRLNDFGAFDVPLALWEVVPYSFVVDWFVPIGTWLAALTPKVGVKIVDSGISVKTVKSVSRTVIGYVPDAVGPGQWPYPPIPLGSSDTFTATSKTRELGLPIPWFPQPRVKLNLKRLTDAAALLIAARGHTPLKGLRI